MEDLSREDLAAFVHTLKQAHIRFGAVTPATFKVLGALEELARDGGLLLVRNPELEAAVAAAASAPMPPDPDIPF